MSTRDARLQAAIVRDGTLLVLEMQLDDGRRFWLLPGGGREPGDHGDAATVVREVREETEIDVLGVRLLTELAAHPDDERYRRYRTFLCHVSDGVEPVVGIRDGIATIARAKWLPLGDETQWDAAIVGDRFLYPQLLAIRATLPE